MWKCPQLVCHDLLDVVHRSKMTTFEVEFEFREKKKSHGLRSGEYGGCGTTGITFFRQKFICGDGSVTGSVIVMQHPSVRNLWPDRMKLFPESLKDLTIVLFINCLSLRHEFLKNNALTVEKTN